MGLKDLLFGGPEARLRRHATRAKNKDAQHADRYSSLVTLAEDGSPLAVEGLLSRFTMRYEKSIDDETEKEYVFSALSKLGGKILPQLQSHLRAAESISWGLKVLSEVTSADERWPLLADLCERNDNTYTRDPSKKIQLLHHLAEEEDVRAAKALLPYLEDIDEGVRYQAVEGLLRHKQPEVAREPLLKLLTSEKEESRRIKKLIADGLCDLGWDVKGFSGTVEKLVADLLPGGRVDGHGRIKKKT